MTWLALLVLGVAVADLTRSTHPRGGVVAAAVGGATVMLAGLAVGVLDLSVLVLLPVVGVVVGWVVLADRACHGGSAARPLLLLGLALLALVVVPLPTRSGWGLFEAWLERAPAFLGSSPEGALLLIAFGLAMSSTGNVVVRLVLQASGTSRPGALGAPAAQLKGGRLLGPMERLFIYGLGLTGNFTAAGIVIAAKGLIRWPELQSKRDRGGDGSHDADIDEITEYFLVGSFLSWMVALAAVVLVDGQLHPGP